MTLRAAANHDRNAVLALGVAEEAAWFGAAEVSAEEVGEWIDEEGGVSRGVVAVDDDGQVRAFALPGRREAVFLADPVRTDALADELLPWLHEQRNVFEVNTFAGDAARVRAFERHGLRHRRSSFWMVRPDSAGPVPPAAFPTAVDVAPYRLGESDEAVHRLIYIDAAWASVAGHAERDLDAWLDKDRPCPTMFLARRGDQLVGWVAGRVLASGRGYISTLAVAPSERGRGIGRALLVHAFADLQLAGARGFALAVEAENETALGLYRSVGLEVERGWRTYATPSGGPNAADHHAVSVLPVTPRCASTTSHACGSAGDCPGPRRDVSCPAAPSYRRAACARTGRSGRRAARRRARHRAGL